MAPDWDPDTLPTSADRNGPCPRCGRHAHFGIVHTTPLCAELHIPDVGKEHVGVLTCMGCGLGTAVIEKELEPPEYTAIDWWPPPGVGNFDPHVPPAVRAFRYGAMRNARTPVTKAEGRGRGIIGEDAPSTPATARHRRTSRRRRNEGARHAAMGRRGPAGCFGLPRRAAPVLLGGILLLLSGYATASDLTASNLRASNLRANAPTDAAPVAAAPPEAVLVAVGARTIAARPGYRRTPAGPVLDAARFTTVATLDLPAAKARTLVLATTVRVTVPIRLALSVRAWCEAPRRATAAPDVQSLGDALVIGQNPIPGGSATAVASRTLTGRAVVTVPADVAARCVLQMSPRTESTQGSSLRLVSGTFSARPVPVVARAAQRPAVLVGASSSPGSAGRARPVHEVARLGPLDTLGAVRLEADVELSTCALGYHLCARGVPADAAVDVALRLDELTAGGAVCRAWRGATRRVTIIPAVHHVKVLLPALTVQQRCGDTVRAWLEVAHRDGNAVEVEPVLLPAGPTPALVQTHTWLESS